MRAGPAQIFLLFVFLQVHFSIWEGDHMFMKRSAKFNRQLEQQYLV